MHKKIDLILASLILIPITFKFMHWPGGNIMLIVFSSLLILYYFLMAFYQPLANKDMTVLNRLLISLGYFSLACILTSILFKAMVWPGSMFQLIVFTIVSLFVALVGILKLFRSPLPSYFVKRCFVIGLLGLMFCFISSRTILNIYYPDDPEYIEAMIKATENPNNHQYGEELKQLRMKREQEQRNKNK